MIACCVANALLRRYSRLGGRNTQFLHLLHGHTIGLKSSNKFDTVVTTTVVARLLRCRQERFTLCYPKSRESIRMAERHINTTDKMSRQTVPPKTTATFNSNNYPMFKFKWYNHFVPIPFVHCSVSKYYTHFLYITATQPSVLIPCFLGSFHITPPFRFFALEELLTIQRRKPKEFEQNYFSSIGWSRLIIFLINRGYVKFSSGIHIACSKGYPVQVTKNSLMVFLPFCTFRHLNNFSTS